MRVVTRPQEQGVEVGAQGQEKKKSMPVYFESRVARGLSWKGYKRGVGSAQEKKRGETRVGGGEEF